ncbi:MetQ/NlpA family ABC transporter substrate-binding protein [Clostridium magnum]|uniref:Lipoprotein n=1 Tax=Clostridium magnum DSM 2767 TaxID=1121326 RepID=A0A161WXD4_9CLOT|nr:MetQ/NlpA family ABC transporter substrate-binding protein [Clostridium magnum]KZL91608.1 D-methionine-binding lipoprotein MetQ precursor [Clostridium magnum DSM 2767]SHH49341.1 D-methionine transport system substrate-binding protein [Clostridium magnum DSM 2767]
MNKLKKIIGITLALTLTLGFSACSGSKTTTATPEKNSKNIVIGVCPGPYGDMVRKAIAPVLEKKGYKVETKEFSDYVQPNKALANKEIDANLFQHTAYLQKFSKDNKLDLSPVIVVPTAGMGIFSNKIKSLDDLKTGAQVAIPNDPSNLARALILLEKQGLIKIKDNIDETKATESDIVENKKDLKIVITEAAQLPRTLDSVDIAAITGNYAIASGLDFSKALKVEKLSENYKNVVAVRTEDLSKDLGKDIKEAVESADFRTVIEDQNGIFKAFDKPEWYVNKK